MKEPLRDAFFQPANHPYFVKEKSFWTIDRVGIQKRADVISIPSVTASDSLYASPRAGDSGGSRAGSVSLSLPPAASSSLQLGSANDAATVTAALAFPSEECRINPLSVVRKTASVQPDKGSSSVGLGNGCCFPAPGMPPSNRGSGIVINAATCPNLCRHASFLTDSLNRRNLLGGYFDADYEDGTIGRDAPAGTSRRRRPRRRSDSLRRDSGSVDSSLGSDQPNVGVVSDRPAGGGWRQCALPTGVNSAAAIEAISTDSGTMQPCAAVPPEFAADNAATTVAVVSAEAAATSSSAPDCQDVCSICSSSSDGSGNAADVIQPVALKLHLADEVRGDVTKLATSLTRRLFFARGPKHEDVPATSSATLYHRDSDRSHLDVCSQPTSTEVQRSASVSRCSISASPTVTQDCVPAIPKEHSRASGQPAQAPIPLRSKQSDLQSSSRRDAHTSVTSTGRRQRSAHRAPPWVTSSSRVSLELQASAETRFGDVSREVVAGSSNSSSSNSLYATTVEQMSVDDSAEHGERLERKQRRCRRRCCRAVTICVLLAVIGAVVAAVITLHFEGQLTSNPVERNTSVSDSIASSTEHPAIGTTTKSPSDSITITFVGALRLMMEFVPEMEDINSTASRNLSRLFCSAVDRIYYNNSDSLVYDPLHGCQVTNLSSGSIKMNFRVTFIVILPKRIDNNSTGTTISDMVKNIVNRLREYIQGYAFDGLLWDKDFFEMYEVYDELMPQTERTVSGKLDTRASETTTHAPTTVQSNGTLQPHSEEMTAIVGHILTASERADSERSSDPWLSSVETDEPLRHAPVTSVVSATTMLASPADNWPTFSTYLPVDHLLLSSSTIGAQPSSPVASSHEAALQQQQLLPTGSTGGNSADAGSLFSTTEEVPRRSPCYSPGATSGGVRLVADPLNCRAFYVCGNGSNVVVHMNCTLHSSYSYYDAAHKRCELCDVAKCNECAGLRPRTNIVLPLLLMLLGRTSSTTTSSALATISSSVTCDPYLSNSGNCSDETRAAGMPGAIEKSLDASSPDVPPIATPYSATERVEAAETFSPSSSQLDSVTASAVTTVELAFTSMQQNTVPKSDLAQLVQIRGSATPDLEQPLQRHGDSDGSDSTVAAPLDAVSVISRRSGVVWSSQISIVSSEPLSGAKPLAETLPAPAATSEALATGTATSNDGFVAWMLLTPSTQKSLVTTSEVTGFQEGRALWQSDSRWTSQSVPVLEATDDAFATVRDNDAGSSSSSSNSNDWSTYNSHRLCSSAIERRSSPLGVVADPNDCTRYAYCFTNGAAVGWQCECGQMYMAEAGECRTCDPLACGLCRPCDVG